MEAQIEGWESRVLDSGVLRLVARDEIEAAKWLEEARWPEGPSCLRCGSDTAYLAGTLEKEKSERALTRPRREWRCRECNYIFTVRRRSFMDGSKASLSAWCTALRLAMNGNDIANIEELADEAGIQKRTAMRLASRAQSVVDSVRELERLVQEDSEPPVETPEPTPAPEVAPPAPAIEPQPQSGFRRFRVAIVLAAAASVAVFIGSSLSESTVLRTEWVTSRDERMLLSTDRLHREPFDEWNARHQERVLKMQGVFEPVHLAKGGRSDG